MSNSTFADALASIIERQAADTITESEAAAEALAAINAWAGLSTTNALLAARLQEFMAVVEGLIVLTDPPTDDIGALGSAAFSFSNRAFYGPKTVSGWGDPFLVLDATVEIGTVQTVATGQPAAVRNVGTPGAAVLEFDLPKGDEGDQGPAGTITINSVTTVAPTEPASVTNTGTPEEAVLDFSIPKGDPGEKGDAATLTINSITMLAADQPPSVTNTGDQFDAVFDIEIPRGETGFVLNSFKGDWQPATAYNEGDIVAYEGDTFIANEGVSGLVGSIPTLASPNWTIFTKRGEAANVIGDTLLTEDATLDEATAPEGKPVRVKASGAPGGAITLTIPDSRPQSWRLTIIVSDGQARLDFGNNTLTIDGEAVDLVADTPVINAGGRVTLLADTIGNIVRL